MPLCFELTRKSNLAAGAVSLNQIDREICDLLGVAVHPEKYVNGWFDYIGFRLATGKSFDVIRSEIVAEIAETEANPATDKDIRDGASYDAATLQRARLEYRQDMLKICDFLSENFTSDNWREIGKRE